MLKVHKEVKVLKDQKVRLEQQVGKVHKEDKGPKGLKELKV